MQNLADTQATTIELTIPAEQRMMIVIRLTTAGVVARTHLTLDAVEDVKMAVEEAAGCLIRFSGCGTLMLRYDISDDWMNITLRAERSGCKPEAQSPDELYTIRYILESMVDRVRLSGQDSGLTSIELHKQMRHPNAR